MKQTIDKLLKIKKDERTAVFFSFLYFFSVLASYYVLRPLRDEMSMQMGSAHLQNNFFTVFITMLALVPLFGWLTKKYARAFILPRIYTFCLAVLLIFYFLFEQGGQQITWLARSFFVWVSVYNLFAVSVFWSYMADIFTTEQSSRLNGLISAGGTLGALTGPLVTTLFIESVGIKNLLLVSGAFLAVAIFCLQKLRHQSGSRVAAQVDIIEHESGFRGSIFSGLIDIFQSHYLLGICIFLFTYATLSTFLYGISTDLIPKLVTDPLQRTKLLAQIDLAVNLVALVGQFFVFGTLVKKFSRGVALVLLPFLSVVGFALFGLTENLWALMGFAVLRRAGEYSISKPTRETLFNVLPPTQKYRAKNVIDTLVHRTGDVLSVSVFAVLQKLGLTMQSFSILSIGLSILWALNSLWLAKKADTLLREARAHKHEPGVHT
ncbi:MAG: hypothetical protein RJB66_1583 [Pseudomonadota bacterium]|jgi:AAA family ATP:ADP antiporter